MLKGFWNHSMGDWIYRFKERDAQRRWNNYRIHTRSFTPLPQLRPRSLTSPGSKKSQGCESSPFGSKLLNLPAEIRMLIWEYAFGGNFIVLYLGEGGRLMHSLLDNTNSSMSTQNVPIQMETIKNAVVRLPNPPRKHSKQRSQTTKLSALALLQSCRLM
jgi:hypothetical protein